MIINTIQVCKSNMFDLKNSYFYYAKDIYVENKVQKS